MIAELYRVIIIHNDFNRRETLRFEGNDNITPYLGLHTKIVISF